MDFFHDVMTLQELLLKFQKESKSFMIQLTECLCEIPNLLIAGVS